jgi:hypothetical protein
LTPDEAYDYCTSYCPSGFTDADCKLPGGSEMIVSYSFNVPANSFTNAGATTTAHDITNAAVKPAKNRGLYFDGASDWFIQVADLKLGHSFSVHAWVFANTGSSLTLMSKDRDSFDPVTNQHHLRLSVTAARKMMVELAQDIDSANYVSKESATKLVTDATWTYLVYSLKMVDGKNKNILFYVDNAVDTQETMTGIF